jgi:hypothetical protein
MKLIFYKIILIKVCPKDKESIAQWLDTCKTTYEEVAFGNRAVSAFRKALRHGKLTRNE